jgi:hypothetical protein
MDQHQQWAAQLKSQPQGKVGSLALREKQVQQELDHYKLKLEQQLASSSEEKVIVTVQKLVELRAELMEIQIEERGPSLTETEAQQFVDAYKNDCVQIVHAVDQNLI